MGAQSSARVKRLKVRLADAFGQHDSVAFAQVDINRASKQELMRGLGVSERMAGLLVAARKGVQIRSLEQLRSIKGLRLATFNRIKGRVLLADYPYFHVADVDSPKRYILSNKPFVLGVHFANGSDTPAAVVSINVLWAGEPFLIEQAITKEDAQRGRVDVQFDEEHTLPVGPVEFLIALYRLDGAQASFRKTFYVLPSNPLSLSLSPAGATVTGTWSARGAFQASSDTFLTECTLTLANGDPGTVTMNQNITWRFWDGGVGGTLVESGIIDLGAPFTVDGSGIWQVGVWFSSPNGSGIYNRYHGKEDMTIELEMVAEDESHVTGTITCRVMLAYGVNIIEVGDFDPQEGIDLFDAVDVTRQIYEKRDITFREVLGWVIHNQDADGYTVIDSDSEVFDLFEDWSVPNDYIDVFVCQDHTTDFDGLAGGIPGPSSKGGDRDGVVVDKTLSTDGSGLDINYLGMLIGHEVGHYLGLPHINEAGNLLLWNSGASDTNLNYDQYRLMFPHGFLVFM